MGGLCSVSISIENTISFCCNHAAKHASYACRLGKHLDVLETKMEELKALRNDVKRRVEIAERQHMKRLDQVEWWLSRVEALEGEVEDLMKESVNEKKCPGCCYPKNCWASYKLGKKAAEMLKKVRRHRKKGQFERVAETLPPAPGDLQPCEHTVGMESMIATVWNCLSEEQAVIIGLYGMGGIGKTTLLTQINNMLLSLPSNVDFVIWAVASKDLKLEKIQDQIGEKIGYSDNRWRNKRIEQKAIDIYRVLSNRKFVLLLDDLWDRVDLTKIGVPIPDQQNNSKVVFTTRSKEVCGLMEAHKRFRVECLPPPFAWHLFQRKVGNDTLNLHPDIPKLAETVAKECAGLPLALITVGRAMASIDFHSSMILKDRCFNNLQRVSVDNCIRLGDLTWLMLAPNLASLCVSRCSQIKEIISTAKCGRLAEVLLGSIKPFEKLEVLHLSYLPELKCIYQDPLPFLSLKKISIFGCPKLKKLPVNVQNAEGHGIAIHGWELIKQRNAVSEHHQIADD